MNAPSSTLTDNSNSNSGGDKQPGVDAANPRANNTMGNIIRWKEDGDLKNVGNNQMLATDPRTGQIRRFLTGPVGCEITEPTAVRAAPR